MFGPSESPQDISKWANVTFGKSKEVLKFSGRTAHSKQSAVGVASEHGQNCPVPFEQVVGNSEAEEVAEHHRVLVTAEQSVSCRPGEWPPLRGGSV